MIKADFSINAKLLDYAHSLTTRRQDQTCLDATLHEIPRNQLVRLITYCCI